MVFQHDFVKFPELTNAQLEFFQFRSPHKQIVDDFVAEVIKVTDGDTVLLRTSFRDFDFPLRFRDVDAPELSEAGGRESQSWLEGRILGERVNVGIDPQQRVGKFGRLLGTIYSRGLNMSDASVWSGHAVSFDARNEHKILSLAHVLSRSAL